MQCEKCPVGRKAANHGGLDFSILPQFMSKIGYDCHMVGKWHLGFYNESYLPTARGFSSYTGYLGDQEHYKTHKYDRSISDDNVLEAIGKTSKHFYDFMEVTEPNGEYALIAQDAGIQNTSSAEIFVTRAKEVLEDAAAAPAGALFLYMAWQNVHGPLDMVTEDYWTEYATEEQVNKFRNIPSWTRRHFGGLTVQLDYAVQQVGAQVFVRNSTCMHATHSPERKHAHTSLASTYIHRWSRLSTRALASRKLS